MSPDTFHFLRPYWLLMLIPLLLLITLYGRRLQDLSHSAWRKVIDPHLLAHLTVNAADKGPSRWRPVALSVALLACIVALAGPTWQRNELPAFVSETPTVLVLSLAQSMNATDLSPDRLTRAGHKVRDFLDQEKGGEYALVIYADQPFVATPLTSDVRVITQMLGELSTNLMPVLGNRLELAIDKASDLLRAIGARQGRIVVIADDAGIDPGAAVASARAAQDAGYRLSVLGVGTEHGASLQTASGRSFKTRDGQQAMTRLASADLGEIAAAGGGTFVKLSAGNADIETLSQERSSATALTQSGARSKFRADAWQDMGYWLLIIPILLAPAAFRKNVLMVLPIGLLVALAGPAPDASAADWEGLWKTPDQQGAQAFNNGDFEAATKTFNQPQWKASALYKAGKFGEAAQLYANAENANDHYNLGNARAKSGELEQALAAYDEALKQQPNDSDVQFNRELVAKLLEEKQRKEREQKKKQDQDQQQKGSDQHDQKQGQDGDKPDQAKAGDKPDQAKAGDKPDQANTGGDKDQRQQGNTEQAGKEPRQASAREEDGKSAFRKAMDALLSGNGSNEKDARPQPPAEQPTANSGLSELDQAHEQQLRAVPDDPSGLLRARIRQHYAQMRSER